MLSSNVESSETALGHGVFDLDLLDARSAGTVAKVAFESFHRLGFAFRRRLHCAVGKVAHPAVQSLAAGGAFGEEPEPHALHAATDQEPARNPHPGVVPVAGSGFKGSAF